MGNKYIERDGDGETVEVEVDVYSPEQQTVLGDAYENLLYPVEKSFGCENRTEVPDPNAVWLFESVFQWYSLQMRLYNAKLSLEYAEESSQMMLESARVASTETEMRKISAAIEARNLTLTVLKARYEAFMQVLQEVNGSIGTTMGTHILREAANQYNIRHQDTSVITEY